MDLSLIISTWNNAERLRDTLADLARCEVEAGVRWELVLVNNACTDATDAVAEAFAGRLPMRYLHEPRAGKSRAQNLALAQAGGGLIVFTDDDVYLPMDWLMCYWRAYRASPGRCFWGGSVRSHFEGTPPEPALRRIAPPSVAGLELGSRARALSEGEDFIGANWAVPAAALAEVGGFDPTMGLNAHPGRLTVGEETDLMRRLRRAGWEARYLPEAWLEHRVPASKCTREHIVARCVAAFRDEAVQRYGSASGRRWIGAARVLWRAARLGVRGWLAPLVGRTGLLSRTRCRGYREAARLLMFDDCSRPRA